MYEIKETMDSLKNRIDMVKREQSRNLMEDMFREIMEFMPRVFAALSDGKITAEEYQELAAYLVDSIVDLTGKNIEIDDAKALVQGIVGLLKAYGLIKTA